MADNLYIIVANCIDIHLNSKTKNNPFLTLVLVRSFIELNFKDKI
jgi:hypothetical protein